MEAVADILLVEDNPRDVTLTLSALKAGNVANDVMVLRDGAEALDYLMYRGRFEGRLGPLPGVVLLDLKMPKVDGLEVLRQMRNHPALKFVPVVMLTSSREERDIVASYRLGVNAYVVKPVDFDQFADAIRQLGLFWAVLNVPPSLAVQGE
ncbi:MAG TPA: response regulator [Candidatus Limnocylindria bacterium]|nr:response regulator [Candidatus Limnocylindria bacterium]